MPARRSGSFLRDRWPRCRRPRPWPSSARRPRFRKTTIRRWTWWIAASSSAGAWPPRICRRPWTCWRFSRRWAIDPSWTSAWPIFWGRRWTRPQAPTSPRSCARRNRSPDLPARNNSARRGSPGWNIIRKRPPAKSSTSWISLTICTRPIGPASRPPGGGCWKSSWRPTRRTLSLPFNWPWPWRPRRDRKAARAAATIPVRGLSSCSLRIARISATAKGPACSGRPWPPKASLTSPTPCSGPTWISVSAPFTRPNRASKMPSSRPAIAPSISLMAARRPASISARPIVLPPTQGRPWPWSISIVRSKTTPPWTPPAKNWPSRPWSCPRHWTWAWSRSNGPRP